MQKMISADRLARPDNFVLMRARRMREIREEQGLDDRVGDAVIGNTIRAIESLPVGL